MIKTLFNKNIHLIIFFFISFIPFLSILDTGYIADDAYNSQIKGAILYQDISLIDRIVAESKGWIFGAGRIFIFNWFWIYSLFYFVTSTFFVKLIGLTILALNFFAFFYLIRKISGSIFIALFSIIFLSIVLQFKPPNDPILAYAFMVPIQWLLIQFSLILFDFYLSNKKIVFIIFSSIFFFLALTIYELGIFLSPLFFFLAYYKLDSVKNAISSSAPFLLISFAISILILYLKLYVISTPDHPEGTYPGANLQSYDLKNYLLSIYYQIISAFPLTDLITGKSKTLIFLKRDFLNLIYLLCVIPFFFYKKQFFDRKTKINLPILFALFLILVPPAIVALSGHQKEILHYGIGYLYLSSIYQYFGTSLFLSCFFYILYFKFNKYFSFKVIVILVVCSLFVYNLGKNNKMVRSMGDFKYPREILEKSIQQGIFKPLKNDSFVFRYMLFPSDYFWSYTTLSDLKIHTCELARINQRAIDGNDNYINCLELLFNVNLFSQELKLTDKDSWLLTYNYDKKYGKSGKLILAKIDSIKLDKNYDLTSILSKSIYVYDLQTNQVELYNLPNLYDLKKITDQRYTDYKSVNYPEFLIY